MLCTKNNLYVNKHKEYQEKEYKRKQKQKRANENEDKNIHAIKSKGERVILKISSI